MQGLVLAAGMGSRLKELTKNHTKGMVEVNGIALMERMLRQLDNLKLSRIIVVTGYEAIKLQDFINSLSLNTEVCFVNNDIYDKTNNIYSVYLAKEEMCKDDTILLESDLIFDDELLVDLMEDSRETLALVDKFEPWMDGTCVEIDENHNIQKFIPGKYFQFNDADHYYKTINIYKFSKQFLKDCYFPFLEAYMSVNGKNKYYETVLEVIIGLKTNLIQAKVLENGRWYEIDDEQDLDIASSIFASSEEQLKKVFSRYGGYWRYPKLLDFCYLVNPYFPPKKLVDELKYNFETLLTQYPSGMGVNSMLAGKCFGIKKEHIVVGNGAAELIKSLMENVDGKTGFVRPTFEEYPNRYADEKSVVFVPKNEDYSYNSQDVIDYFKDKELSTLVIVNPDNPSGNYIAKEDMFKLVEWTKQEKITFLLDESFVDFADELDSTFIDQNILNDNPHLFVMKSISKSYGVPGLRLGVLASSDEKVIQFIKKDVSIWNINSFGEFYLQIYEKYKKDYIAGLVKFREERKRYVEKLNALSAIRVIPSQANYVMVELNHDITTNALCELLLVKYNILIKDLSSKLGGKKYLRLAVRNEKDNDALVEALKIELE